MRTKLLLLVSAILCIVSDTMAQAPQLINYQAVVRNAQGQPVMNTPVNFQFIIHDGSAGGTAVFTETDTATTNQFGLATMQIGGSTSLSGVSWGSGNKYLEVGVDVTGGSIFTDMGTTQLVSVPYALNSGNSYFSLATNNADIHNTNSGNVGIGTTSPTEQLHTTLGVRHEVLQGTGNRPVFADSLGRLNAVHALPLTADSSALKANNGFGASGCTTLTLSLAGYPTNVASANIKVQINFTAYDGLNDFPAFFFYLQAPDMGLTKLGSIELNNSDFSNDTVRGNISFSDAGNISADPYTALLFVSNSTLTKSFYSPAGEEGSTNGCGNFINGSPAFGSLGGGSINPNGNWNLVIESNNAPADSIIITGWSVSFGNYGGVNGLNNYVTKWVNGSLSDKSNLYDDGTNVGIGTTSPSTPLHLVTANTNPAGSGFTIEANSGYGNETYAGLLFNANASNSGVGPAGRIYAYYPNNNYTSATMTFQSVAPGPSMVDVMSVTNGAVGIGTTTPVNTLDVNGSIAVGSYAANNGAPANGAIISGNTGIGTPAPVAMLEVRNSTQHQSSITLSGQEYQVADTNSESGLALVLGINRQNNKQLWIMDQDNVATPSSSHAMLRIYPESSGASEIDAMATDGHTYHNLILEGGGGNVGIGTNNPTDLLSVNGAANNTTGAWGVFSDSRVKTLEGDFTDGLNIISQIHTVKFSYNANAPFKASGQQIGVVAQELEKIAPYMVSQKRYEQFSDLREVNNQAYVFLLINAVKELKQQNEKMQKQINELKNLKK